MNSFRAPRLGLALALLLTVSAAHAQPAQTDVDRARELARESADLLDQKKYADALDRATRAEALYHAPFHLEVIAESLEGLGRLAEAAAKYEALTAEPLPKSAPKIFQDAQQKAKQRLSQLLAKVPSLLVVVRGEASGAGAGAAATVDGKEFSLAAGTAVRFDPGAHEVKVTAAGFKPFSRTVTLPERGGVVVVEAVLEREGAPAGTATATATAAPSASAAGSAAPSEGSLLPAGLAYGAGALGLALGAVAGGMFLSRLGGLQERCPEKRCSPADESEIGAVRTLGDLSTAGFAIAGAGLVVGTVLVLVRPGGAKGAAKPPSKAEGASIGPWIGAGSVGVVGRF